MREQTGTVNNIRMRWEEEKEGDGPPIIYIHGIRTSPRLWRRVIPQVDWAQALAWELVGYGGSISQGRQRDISVARQADYLIE